MYYYTLSDLYLAVLVVTAIKISIYNEASYFENIQAISIMLSNQWLKSNVANYHVQSFFRLCSREIWGHSKRNKEPDDNKDKQRNQVL